MATSVRRLSWSLLLLLIAVPAYAQAPSGLAATVDGTTVTLSWSGAGSSVEASVVPGGAVVASLPVAGNSLTVPNVPAGTYYVRVRGAGGVSNEVAVSVSGSTGCPGPPLPPRLIVRSTGTAAQALWSSGGGCPPTSYTLFAGSGPGLSDITVVNSGGPSGVGANAPPGNYYVRVLGTNQYGSTMSDELLLRVAVNALSDTVSSQGAVLHDIIMNLSGNYQASLVWSDPSVDLDLYFTSAGCSYPPSGCLLSISDATGTNTEGISYSVASGQSYRLWVDNFSPRAMSYTIYNSIAGAPLPAGDQPEPGALQIRKIKP